MANNNSSFNQRFFKNLLIYPKMQIKYTLFNVAICLVLIVAYSSVFYAFIKENYFAFIELGFLDDAVKTQMYSELHKVYQILFVSSFLFLILIVYVSISFSHRVAGPIYKMTKVLKEMRESNAVTKISLRKNDEFKELCEEINMVINQFIQTDQTTNSQQNKNKQESA
jgi:hypothetical protein